MEVVMPTKGVKPAWWRSQIFAEPLDRIGRYVSGIVIDGVEVTQAIQYRRAADHLTDPADRGNDNTVTLVADKPAYVRVYVRSTGFAPITGVTGTVTVQRRQRGLWVDADTLVQQAPTTLTAQLPGDYDAERRNLNRSLNFLISSRQMVGNMRLVVHVEVPGTLRHRADTTVDISASLRQTLRVRCIPVRYDGKDTAGNPTVLAPPTLTDARNTVATAAAMFPVSPDVDITMASTMNWFVPLDGDIVVNPDGSSSCPSSWTGLLAWLALVKSADGNRADHFYYALLPAAMPIGGAGGCGGGSTGVAAGRAGFGRTMAHELGHVAGFGHAPFALATGDMGDPAYPAYEPYDATSTAPTGNIGEYGLDTTTGRVYRPTDKDIMSYAGTRWISLYHYRKLIEHPMLDPTWLPETSYSVPLDDSYPLDRPPWLPLPDPFGGRKVYEPIPFDPVPLVVVTGTFDDTLTGRGVDVHHVVRLETAAAPLGRPLDGAIVELLDGRGEVIARAPLHVALTMAGGCRCGGGAHRGHDEPPTSGLVQALVPAGDVEDAQRLRIVRDGEEVWSRDGGERPPRVSGLHAECDEEEMRLEWNERLGDRDRDGESGIVRLAQWSGDGGETWHVLAVGLGAGEAVVDASAVPSGHLDVKVIVSDGFHTAESEPVPVDVPERAPDVTILWPADDAVVELDAPLRMWCAATGSDGRQLPDESLHWELDGHPVGRGREAWAHLGDWQGRHRCTLIADDGRRRSVDHTVFTATFDGREIIHEC
jgi:hypothetical protein